MGCKDKTCFLKGLKFSLGSEYKHMKKLLLMGGCTLLLMGVMVVGALFAVPMSASAQTPPPTSTPTVDPYCEQYLRDLASRLHVSVSSLQQANQAAVKDTLARMVRDGAITQKQASALQQRLMSYKPCTGNITARLQDAIVMHTLKGYRSQINDQIARGLHLTPSQLTSQLKSGKSLDDVAAAQHVSSSQLHTIVMGAIQSALNTAVSKGDLTKQEATTYMQFLRSHPKFLNHILSAHHAMGYSGSMP
jgi:polyhydroxyalkanoate synthesis regulator phasin